MAKALIKLDFRIYKIQTFTKTKFFPKIDIST